MSLKDYHERYRRIRWLPISGPQPKLRYQWLFNNQPATDAIAANPSCSQILNGVTIFTTYSPTIGGHVVPSVWNPVTVAQFGDYTQIPGGTTVPGPTVGSFTYVMYDSENWVNTPSGQQSPLSAIISSHQSAQTAAHGSGRQFMAAPAANLASLSGNGGFSDKYHGYLSINLAGSVAPYADWLCIQSQGLIGGPSSTGVTFSQFVLGAMQQARAANPLIKIIVGISTTDQNSGIPFTAAQIEAAITSIAGLSINGLWFNCPPHSPESAVTDLVVAVITQMFS